MSGAACRRQLAPTRTPALTWCACDLRRNASPKCCLPVVCNELAINHLFADPDWVAPAVASRSPQGRMRRLLADLGDPQADWPAAVHVAGTKGKGSTVAMLAAILRAAGYKAGAYTRCGQLRRVLLPESWHRFLRGSMLEALRRPPCMCRFFSCSRAPASPRLPLPQPAHHQPARAHLNRRRTHLRCRL